MYVGLDVHKTYCYATVLDQEGQIMAQERFLSTVEELDQFLETIEDGSEVAIEASGIWGTLYDHLEDRGLEVTLAHPVKTRAIAEARIKTDKIDSETLAHLLRADLLPASYVPDPPTRALRTLVRHRAILVRNQTAIKNRIHGLLNQVGVRHPFSDLFGVKGKRFLRELELGEIHALTLNNYLAVLDVLKAQIEETTEFMKGWVKNCDKVSLLESIPGMGTYSAVLILSEIGEIERFATPKQLSSYAGLVPRVHQSGQIQRYGHITKEGSPWLRWAMIQTVHRAIRMPGLLQRQHARLAKQKGKNKATVAVARKMLTYIYSMLKEGKRFEELRVNQARAPRQLD